MIASFILCLLFALNNLLFPQDTSKSKSPAVQQPSRADSARQAAAQPAGAKKDEEKDEALKTAFEILAVIVGLAGFLFGVYQYHMRKRDKAEETFAELQGKERFEEHKLQKQQRTAEELYRHTLQDELGSIKMLGSPDIESLPVKLLDTFVLLELSETWRSETRFEAAQKIEMHESSQRHFPPEKVLQRAFQKERLLLIIGDPGSGKTTLMKYYAMCCLDGDGHQELGFSQPVLPLYFPLRELAPEKSLPENLAKWAQDRVLNISAPDFHHWLHGRPTLVLLDGLDEISDLESRRNVCEWIDKTCAGLHRARFIVTSRWTGYRKADGVELSFPHWRADVRDFTPEQQQDFLRKWFCAAYLRELPDEREVRENWEQRQRQLAAKRAEEVIVFLQKPENHGLRQLAAVPMLLQIMAIIWKTRENLPEGRAPLYNASLNYLLAFRDARRKLNPVLPPEKARRALTPIALWMQNEQKDAAGRDAVHELMQPILDTMDERPPAAKFCANLRDRAGLLVEYGKQEYLFRHKSFREFFAAEQLAKECHQPERLQELIAHFGEDWWEEPLRFFMCLADDAVFDRFMQNFFAAPVSENLDQKGQKLLRDLMQEAPQKRVDSLVACLADKNALPNRQRYALDCLKMIASPAARKAVQEFVNRALTESRRQHETKTRSALNQVYGDMLAAMQSHSSNQKYAEDILAEWQAEKPVAPAAVVANLFQTLPKSFRNPLELNAEYILIPGAQEKIIFESTKKPAPDYPLYFAKYPVTNKLYRLFMDYLEGKNKEALMNLPREQFEQKILANEEMIQYLGNDPKRWAEKFKYEDDKRFSGDDQPVSRVSWLGAMAYCHWLTALHQNEAKSKRQNQTYIFRLPIEEEWEWAASGGKRKFPWGEAEPDETRANYEQKVGHTTPVGAYPAGATPERLLDMAGNVWEWMENLYQDDKKWRALRGGSWSNDSDYLQCGVRYYNDPDLRYYNVGFRVVCAQSRF